ncbi:unnamed protein product [Protopolystoma xenopodis]|uniref:Uncharacterized protein n=1 Tax=Protopolystoma xenopodis TaxID=117903 RepID=A0A448XJ99_9PLAT|nr:unnamed protein product [Protopolystoma xenopodis]
MELLLLPSPSVSFILTCLLSLNMSRTSFPGAGRRQFFLIYLDNCMLLARSGRMSLYAYATRTRKSANQG